MNTFIDPTYKPIEPRPYDDDLIALHRALHSAIMRPDPFHDGTEIAKRLFAVYRNIDVPADILEALRLPFADNVNSATWRATLVAAYEITGRMG